MPGQSFILYVTQRGRITLPRAVRNRYNIQPGQALTLVDLDGIFVLSPRTSQIDSHADALAKELAARGESLEGMFQILRELRTTPTSS